MKGAEETSFLTLSYACWCASVHVESLHLVKYCRGVKQGCPMSPLLFNIYFSIVDRYLDTNASQLGLDVGSAHTLRCIYYADDVVLLAHSMQQLQSLFDLFEKCASQLNMIVNPIKSGVIVFNGHGDRSTNTLMSVRGPIQNVKEYCYLGIIINAECTWEQARLHRADLANKDRDTVVSYLKSQHLYHMQAIATHFNANIMQTLLYGCPVWGWSYFLSWDLIRNPFQCQLSQLIRTVYKLPISTPHIALMCESGVWPIMYYALKQTTKFVEGLQDTNSHMLQHLVDLPLQDGVRQRFAALQQRIHALNGLQQQHPVQPDQPHQQSNFMEVLENTYTHILQQQAADPRDANCEHRKIASYLQWIWNGKLHKRPKFYDMDLNARQYHLCLHTRFLHSYLPVYHQVYKPFQERTCPLCHSQQSGPCDLQHVLSECPHTLLIYNQTVGELGPEALLFPQLLSSNNVDVWKYIASCLQMILNHVRIRQKHTNHDD
jgi:Reverse transcriptase (RNA-dependent DNA polymerase)